MKEELKYVLYTLGGAIVGGGLSYLITKAQLRKKYKKQIDDISAVVTKLVVEKEQAKEPEPVEKEVKNEYEKVVEALHQEAAKRVVEMKMQEAKEKIREVGEKEFLESENELRYLSYYEDDVVTDNRDQPIEHPEAFLGPAYGDFFIDKKGGIVHIVNDILKEKYSIEICNEPYGDEYIPEVNVFPEDDDDEEDY